MTSWPALLHEYCVSGDFTRLCDMYQSVWGVSERYDCALNHFAIVSLPKANGDWQDLFYIDWLESDNTGICTIRGTSSLVSEADVLELRINIVNANTILESKGIMMAYTYYGELELILDLSNFTEIVIEFYCAWKEKDKTSLNAHVITRKIQLHHGSFIDRMEIRTSMSHKQASNYLERKTDNEFPLVPAYNYIISHNSFPLQGIVYCKRGYEALSFKRDSFFLRLDTKKGGCVYRGDIKQEDIHFEKGIIEFHFDINQYLNLEEIKNDIIARLSLRLSILCVNDSITFPLYNDSDPRLSTSVTTNPPLPYLLFEEGKGLSVYHNSQRDSRHTMTKIEVQRIASCMGLNYRKE